MFPSHNENLMRAAFAPARALDATEAEIAHVLARVRAEPKRSVHLRARGARLRFAMSAVAGLAIVASSAYAVPATRAAIDDLAGTVASTFTGWIGGDSADAPGRPLTAIEQAPSYFHEGAWTSEHINEPRVIAEAGGYKLYAYLERQGTVGFDLGDTGVGLGGYAARDFEDHALLVLGPGAMQRPDEQGHVPLFGITARSVTTVELRYESGPSLRVDGIDGGFVLLAEPNRRPREVVALDAQGDVIEQQPVDDSAHPGPRIDWQQYDAAPAG